MKRIRVVLPAMAAMVMVAAPAAADNARRWPLDPRTGTVEVYRESVTCPGDGWTFTVAVHLEQGNHVAEVRETVNCHFQGEVIPMAVRTSSDDGRFHAGTAQTGESYIWCQPPGSPGPPCTSGSFASRVELVPTARGGGGDR